jgi:GMP synthase (glutamine-hydrolysing)
MRLLSLQHPKADEAGTFALAARAAGHSYDEWCPGDGQGAPGDPAGYDGIVVLGGEQNVADAPRLPYLREEIALIGEALERRQPLLGVCLGAQLLVAAAGGEVVRVPEPEIGWYEVAALPEAARDPLFGALPERFSAYCWHSYGVELPAEATPLARSAVCIHGFRLGDAAWGVQFHPEVTREILLGWFASYRDDPDAVAMGFDPQRAEAELAERLGGWEALGRRLFGAFAAAAYSATRTSQSSS